MMDPQFAKTGGLQRRVNVPQLKPEDDASPNKALNLVRQGMKKFSKRKK
jgi:hypothetical protein